MKEAGVLAPRMITLLSRRGLAVTGIVVPRTIVLPLAAKDLKAVSQKVRRAFVAADEDLKSEIQKFLDG